MGLGVYVVVARDVLQEVKVLLLISGTGFKV